MGRTKNANRGGVPPQVAASGHGWGWINRSYQAVESGLHWVITPADVSFGRGNTILLERERIKRKTIENRRLLYQNKAG